MWELRLIDRIIDGSATHSERATFQQFADSVGLLLSAVMIISEVAVLAWLSRTVEIVPQLGGGTPRRSPREAIGWWFIPIASFVIPFQIVRDVHRRLETPSRRGGDGAILAWWLLFIVGGVVLRAARFAINGATTFDTLRSYEGIAVAAFVATAASGLLLVRIVREIESRASGRAVSASVRGPDEGWPGSAAPPSWSSAVAATTPSRIVGPADPTQLGRYRVLEAVGPTFVPGQIVDPARHGPSIVLEIAGRSYWMVPAGETTVLSSGNRLSLSRGSEGVTLERVDGPPTALVVEALRVPSLPLA
jgi:hypothetical protein